MYITDADKNKVTHIPFVLWVISINTGDKHIPRTEPRETYLLTNTIIIKAAKQVSAKTGFIASIEPKEVATPFPPLNPKNAGQLCPITTATTAI